MSDKIFGIHAQTLRLRAERAQILASNLANADTPGYKARDINIKDAFSHLLNEQATLTKTNSAHFSASTESLSGLHMQYRIPNQPAIDGNTVDMQIERAEFMQNALKYQASLRFASGRIGGLMTAIRGE